MENNSGNNIENTPVNANVNNKVNQQSAQSNGTFNQNYDIPNTYDYPFYDNGKAGYTGTFTNNVTYPWAQNNSELLLKSKTKENFNKVTLGPLLYFILSYLLNFIYAVILQTFQVSIPEGNTFIICVSTIMNVIAFTLPFIIVAKISGLKSSELLYNKSDFRLALPLIMVGCAALMISNVVANVFCNTVKIFGIQPKMAESTYDNTIFGKIIFFIVVAIVPALIEEFAFRGVFLGALRKHCSDTAAILICAGVFGLIHGNLIQIPFAFMVGLILSYLVVKTGSIWPSVILHFINNGASVILTFITDGLQPSEQNIIDNLYVIFFIIIGFAGFILYSRQTSASGEKKSDDTDDAGSTEITVKKAVGWFASSGVPVVFFVFVVIQILLVQLTQ